MIESIIITLLIGGSLVSLGLSVKGRMAYYFVFVCAAIGAAVRAPEPTNWFVGLFILPLTIMGAVVSYIELYKEEKKKNA